MKKNYFFSQSLKFVYSFFIVIAMIAFVASCKDKEDAIYEDVTVQYKVETKNALITNVVTQTGSAQSTTFDVNKTSWQSAAQVVNTSVGAVHLAATGFGEEMILKIFINGEVSAETKIQGGDLKGKAVVTFPYVVDGQYKD